MSFGRDPGPPPGEMIGNGQATVEGKLASFTRSKHFLIVLHFKKPAG
jgi:hypothetical protein